MAARKNEFGERHPDTLEAMLELELAHREDQPEEAEMLLRYVTDVKRQDLGEDDRTVLTCMTKLGEVYCQLGREAESEQIQLDVLETRKRVLGMHDDDTINSMEQLAIWYQNRGEYLQNQADLDSAEKFLRMVLEANTVSKGRDHEETFASARGLASIHRVKGSFEEAERMQSDLVERSRAVLGWNNTSTAASLEELATIYLAQGRTVAAKDLQKEVVDIYKSALGNDHPWTLEAAKTLETYNHR